MFLFSSSTFSKHTKQRHENTGVSLKIKKLLTKMAMLICASRLVIRHSIKFWRGVKRESTKQVEPYFCMKQHSFIKANCRRTVCCRFQWVDIYKNKSKTEINLEFDTWSKIHIQPYENDNIFSKNKHKDIQKWYRYQPVKILLDNSIQAKGIKKKT